MEKDVDILEGGMVDESVKKLGGVVTEATPNVPLSEEEAIADEIGEEGLIIDREGNTFVARDAKGTKYVKDGDEWKKIISE